MCVWGLGELATQMSNKQPLQRESENILGSQQASRSRAESDTGLPRERDYVSFTSCCRRLTSVRGTHQSFNQMSESCPRSMRMLKAYHFIPCDQPLTGGSQASLITIHKHPCPKGAESPAKSHSPSWLGSGPGCWLIQYPGCKKPRTGAFQVLPQAHPSP